MQKNKDNDGEWWNFLVKTQNCGGVTSVNWNRTFPCW